MNRFLVILLVVIGAVLNAGDSGVRSNQIRVLDSFAKELAEPFLASPNEQIQMPLIMEDKRFEDVTVDQLRDRLNSRFNLTIERRNDSGDYYVVRSKKSQREKLTEYFNQCDAARNDFFSIFSILSRQLKDDTSNVDEPPKKKRKITD